LEPTISMQRVRDLGRGVMLAGAFALVVACSGPDSGDDSDPTPSPTVTPTATIEPSPTVTLTPSLVASPTLAATSTPEPSPTEAIASPTAGASPTRDLADLSSELPATAELPAEGYIIAEEGNRSAQELANAYSDPSAHLNRLNDWGFKRHVYRAFSGPSAAENEPYAVLTTVNEYGSAEQATDALEWLRRLATTQGAEEVDPPRVGDGAVSLTLPTAGGIPTASIYVRRDAIIYVYFAEGGDPLPFIEAIAESVFARR
jgi:hypothetical protein